MRAANPLLAEPMRDVVRHNKKAWVVLLIPLFSLLFGLQSTSSMEASVIQSIVRNVHADATLDAPRKAELQSAWESMSIVEICTSTDADRAGLRGSLESVCDDLWQLRMIALLGGIAFALIPLCVLVVGALVFWARRSRQSLYTAFKLGYALLRTFVVVEVLLQSVLFAGLSFWVTAMWFEFYSVKLVIVGVVLALGAAGTIVMGLFRRVDATYPINGVKLSEADAPAFFASIHKLCNEVGTPPPEHVVVGVDDNFFVSAVPQVLHHDGKEELLHGRILYASLSLLRRLSRDEAHAVMAHEFAHFSGDDTAFSKKMSPLLHKFGVFMGMLAEGTGILYAYLVLFRAGFEVALQEASRAREFRADSVGANIVGKEAAASALVKTAAYGAYRARVEGKLFEANTDARDASLDIFERVSAGFADYADSSDVDDDLVTAQVPHPFDSHPSLQERLQNLNLPLAVSDMRVMLQRAPSDSVVDDIPPAEDIERALWSEYERAFAAAHAHDLAYRLDPADPEARALVEEHFPPRSFADKKNRMFDLDVFGMKHDSWDDAVQWGDVENMTIEDAMLGQVLRIRRVADAGGGKVEVPWTFAAPDVVLEALNSFFVRHQTMVGYQAYLAEQAANEAASTEVG